MGVLTFHTERPSGVTALLLDRDPPVPPCQCRSLVCLALATQFFCHTPGLGQLPENASGQSREGGHETKLL